jgi:hypothetical protein
VTGDFGISDFNDLGQLAYQNVSECGKSWGVFAPWVHLLFKLDLYYPKIVISGKCSIELDNSLKENANKSS